MRSCWAMRRPKLLRSRVLNDSDDENLFMIASEWSDAERRRGLLRLARVPDFQGVRILMREDPFIILDDVRARVTRCSVRHEEMLECSAFLQRGRAIPNFSIRLRSVLGLSPELGCAAPSIRHRVVSSTVRIWRFSISTRVTPAAAEVG